mmetsp:Transcript_8114/g.14295  ORF Transcript_8114/g.14295 Transcript_8114/m.14295 type:complete len:198 (-) Transcript_8114:262-855(-)
MTRFIASLLCLLLSVALPGVSKFAQASSIRKFSSQPQQQQLSPSQRTLLKSNKLDPLPLPIIALITNTTNNTTTNVTTPSPTPAIVPSAPTPPPTHPPSKKYESPEDTEEKKEETKVGIIFLWIVVAFTLIWLLCYFRDIIFFFFGNAWNNTRRFGCKGCLNSFFPCIFGPQMGGGGSEPLDQIIFESEDPNVPLMS